jgi:hypothetical protein
MLRNPYNSAKTFFHHYKLSGHWDVKFGDFIEIFTSETTQPRKECGECRLKKMKSYMHL